MTDSNVATLPTAAQRLPVAVDVDNPISLYLDTGVFEQMQRVAKMMSRSGLVPEHLRGEDKIADCFLVVAQAMRWRLDPLAVAQHTYVLRGKLGYEGKLIAALVNTNSRMASPLRYSYTGEGLQRRVTVAGRLKGETEDRIIVGTVADWQTANEQWKKNPDQMLAYRGAREWARRYMPEAMLGILSDDELDAAAPPPMRDVTPRAPGAANLKDALSAGTAPEVIDVEADTVESRQAATPAPEAPAEPAPINPWLISAEAFKTQMARVKELQRQLNEVVASPADVDALMNANAKWFMEVGEPTRKAVEKLAEQRKEALARG